MRDKRMAEERTQRKSLRLKEWDYSGAGYYFVTVCVKEKKHLLGRCVGADVLIGPHIELSQYGKSVENILSQMPNVDKYVVMPNHIHMIFAIPVQKDGENGPMRTSAPTIPGLVRYFKRMVTQQCGDSIWQRSYYDHIIRDEADYLRIWEYIEENPAKWTEDEYYTG